ncbi:putative protein OS=Eoetvoesiella caeni OX=645616 GN=DFR37_109150 PE=4 SV=1 [Eoetvoesiella caeni]|uniref:Uncharacterized protein n=1 Tax=Eoetvoesiella caeni TaxID=645616 RepID=A0A366H6I6_9BURK|nr:hypothetical protein DFR37_109150 [Eoetvoesiella caeni]
MQLCHCEKIYAELVRLVYELGIFLSGPAPVAALERRHK